MPKPKRERWTVTLGAAADRAPQPMAQRVKMWLKHAWRSYRLKNVGMGGTDDRWTVTFEMAGTDFKETVSAKVGRLLEDHTACYGLEILDLEGRGPDGRQLGPYELSAQNEVLRGGPILLEE